MSKFPLTVFEHQTLRVGDKVNDIEFGAKLLSALQIHSGQNGVPYYSLTYNGVRFNEYVGVIQIGNTLIEVLPKADKGDSYEIKNKWRDILIGMLKAVGSFDIKATSNSNLKIKPNTILDLYFEMFIQEVEYLLHNGLFKQYRKKEGNVTALKGSLQFSKHIQQNLTHQERFYVRYTTYDVEHKLHQILYKTILLLKQINTNVHLHSRIGALLLNFPEMLDIKVTEATFEKIVYNRKNLAYKKSIEIAKLLLLKYHPDLSKGRNHVLALMFDMNVLWEKFVYISLRKNKETDTTVKEQVKKYFWKPARGIRSHMKPDIVLTKNNQNFVLDTKWKNLNGYNPSLEDLRQMYVYHQYFDAGKVALIYPGENPFIVGHYLDPKTQDKTNIECSTIFLSANPNIKEWQKSIQKSITDWSETQ